MKNLGRALGPLLVLTLASCGSTSPGTETVELSPTTVLSAAGDDTGGEATSATPALTEMAPTTASGPFEVAEETVAAMADEDFVEAVAGTFPSAAFVIAGRATNYRIVDQFKSGENCGYALVVADVTIEKVYQGPTDTPSELEVSWSIECPVDLSRMPSRALLFLDPIDITPTDPDVPPTAPPVTLPSAQRREWIALENATFPITDKQLPLIQKALAQVQQLKATTTIQ
jgi:hypothetical protein